MYESTAIIEQRKKLILSILDTSRGRGIAGRIAYRIGQRPFALIEDDSEYDVTWAASEAEALDVARDRFDPTVYDAADGTLWIDVRARDVIRRTLSDRVTFAVDPDEPNCDEGSDRDGHDWQSPYEVLGGLRENPGVWGHGAGLRYSRVCSCCGTYRDTDTWAQRRDTGEQGLTSVRYREADEASLAWVQSIRDGEKQSSPRARDR